MNLNARNVVQDVKEKSFWGSAELGYGWNMRDNGKSGDMNLRISDGGMRSLRLKAGYYLMSRFSLGAGLGLRYYNTGNLNTLPIFPDIRYHIKSLPELYAYTDIGASLEGTDKAFTSGSMLDIGVAYKIRLGKRISLNPAIGYNLFKYSREFLLLPEKRLKHTVFLQLGFQFQPNRQ
jgi:hypothetical protein